MTKSSSPFSFGLSGLVDFHCHLDLYSNHKEIIQDCERWGIKTLSVTNAPSVWPRNQAEAQNCQHVRVALGLHPQLAHEREGELELFEKYMKETRYIGEVGLDGAAEFQQTLPVQRRVFRAILDLCARDKDKVLTVHSRRASRETIETIGSLLPKSKGKVVLHWFTGTKSEAKLAEQIGCYFSVNTRMLASAGGREIINSLSPERVLTETDGPFIKIQNASILPKDVSVAVRELGRLWGISEPLAIEQIKENLRTLLS